MTTKSYFSDIETALGEIRAGKMIIVVDDEDRENEGDLTMAAEKITPEAINFMAAYGRGLICMPMTGERLDYLRIGPMTAKNTAQFGTAFTESIDALGRGVTSGISAYDRAQTVLTCVSPTARPSDLARPGHIFPLRARKGGVLVRGGQTEAAVDLSRMAGLAPAGVICEIMNDDGTMSRVPQLTEFCRRHDMKMITVAELVRYRMAHEKYISRIGESKVTTESGEFRMLAYTSEIDSERHIVLVRGDVDANEKPVPVRIQNHCAAGNIFHDSACDCAGQLRGSLELMAQGELGAVIYLRHTATGYMCESNGKLIFHSAASAVPALELARRFQQNAGIVMQILRDLNVRRIRLLTNHPRSASELQNYGIEVVDQIPIRASGSGIVTQGGSCSEIGKGSFALAPATSAPDLDCRMF